MFMTEFRDGSKCAISWYEDQETRSSFAEPVLGGEDDDRLIRELMDRVYEIPKSVVTSQLEPSCLDDIDG